MMAIRRLLRRRLLHLLALLLMVVSGCATAPPPLTGLIPGRTIETLQSDISISLKQGKETRGARGYLVYQRPDRFHLALLSPFGQSLLEVYSWHDRLTCVFPGDRIAYSGAFNDLPEQQGARLWGLMQWIVDLPGPGDSSRELSPVAGEEEKVVYDHRGLVQRRVSEQGDQADYADYRNVDGIAFPLSVELRDTHNNSLRLAFDEPELNRPLDEESLVPHLDKFQVYPLEYFRGL